MSRSSSPRSESNRDTVTVKPAAQSSFFLSCFVLNIEVLASSKRGLTIYQSTRRNVKQKLQHHCENFQVPRCSVIVTVGELDKFKTLLTVRLLMSYIYIYGAPILDVSRLHTTTQHSR